MGSSVSSRVISHMPTAESFTVYKLRQGGGGGGPERPSLNVIWGLGSSRRNVEK